MNTERAERVKRVKAMHDKSATSISARGGILEQVILLEDILTNVIAWCFYPAPDKSGGDVTEQLGEDGISLKFLILSKLDFKDKIDVLKDVIMAKKPDVWENNKQLVTGVVKELENIKRFRNLLAHSPLDRSKEYLLSDEDNAGAKSFKVLQYQKGKIKPVIIDIGRIKLELRKIEITWDRLLQLFALLRDDDEDAKVCEQLVEIDTSLSDEEHDKRLKVLLKAYGLNHS